MYLTSPQGTDQEIGQRVQPYVDSFVRDAANDSCHPSPSWHGLERRGIVSAAIVVHLLPFTSY